MPHVNADIYFLVVEMEHQPERALIPSSSRTLISSSVYGRNGALARKGIDTWLQADHSLCFDTVEMKPQPERALIQDIKIYFIYTV